MDLLNRTPSFFLENGPQIACIEHPWFQTNAADIWADKHRKISKRRFEYSVAMNMILDALIPIQGKDILEVGPGYGDVSFELANRGSYCIAIDSLRTSIRSSKVIERHFCMNGLEPCLGDGCRLPFKDEAFDAVVSCYFFEHARELNLAFEEQIRVLKRGGILCFMQPNILNPATLFDMLFVYPLRTSGNYGGLNPAFTVQS